MKKFAVMGNPIAHSKSPEIHQAFARQFNIVLSYERILVPEGGLAHALQAFFQQGGSGVNITLPFKEEAFRLANEVTDRARQAQVVNTLTFSAAGLLRGDNTDGIGLCRDLQVNHHAVIRNMNLLIIGAGGAVRGILTSLLSEHPKKITIANRTIAKAEQLVKEYRGHVVELTSCTLNGLAEQKFDLVINATSASTKGEALSLPAKIAKGAICYDLAYGKNAQAFLSWAKTNDAARFVDGFGMLVEQAAEAFYLWHGKKPDTQSVIKS